MAYQVLSLKWRPQTFADVMGQDHITQTLINAFKKDRIAQAYVFTGPRGVGKTTMARLMAKGLNCTQPVDHEPCNSCSNCQEITNSRNIDVLEIDGASNRGIDEIRHLRENIKFSPMNGKFKVYIIDEAHMLTNPAFNALLRTLEEPPAHGKFILCTTDIHKMPATIISRCQRFDFNRINSRAISEHIKHILDEEKISFDDESVTAISRKADGSMRDGLSLLDQIIAFAGDKIIFDEITLILGIIPFEIYFSLTSAINTKNGDELLVVIKKIRDQGAPLEDVINGLNQHIRNMLIATVTGGAKTLEVNTELQTRYMDASTKWDRRDLMRVAEEFSKLETNIHRVAQPQIFFEMGLLKLLEMDKSVKIDDLLNQMGTPQNENPVSTQTIKVNYPPAVKSPKEKKTIELKISDNKTSVESTPKPIEKPSENQRSQFNLELIKRDWLQVINKIAKIKTSVSMVLEHTLPIDLNNRRLDVAIFDQPKFSQGRLERNRTLIEDTFADVFHETVSMIFHINEDVEEDIKHEIPDISVENINSDPVVKKVIELFDGEILR